MSDPSPQRPADRCRPDVSVVVPVVERAGDLVALHRELVRALEASGRTSEIVFVVDERQRASVAVLGGLPAGGPERIVLRLGGTFGESAALTVGLREARGRQIVTLPSYFQVELDAVPAALDLLDAGADLVVARRFPRGDAFFNRLQSRLFHLLVRAFTGARFADISCGFRAMRADLAAELNVYGGLHRFIPVMADHRGYAVRELPVAQRREDHPLRYYGIAVYVKRLIDLLTVFFLLKFTHRPMRFFGFVGLLLAALGAAIDLALAADRLLAHHALADRPLLLLGVLLVVLGIQTLSLGLLGEVIIFTHARNLRDYHVAEVVRSPPEAAAPRPRAAVERRPAAARRPGLHASLVRRPAT